MTQNPLIVAFSSLALAGALLMSACKPEAPDLHEERRPVASERAKVAKAALSAGAAAPAKVSGLTDAQARALVAKVGDVEITLGDVAAYVAQLPRSARSRYVTAEQRVELLKKLVELELLAGEGEKKGFKTDPIVQHTYKRALAEEVLRGVGTELSLADISKEDVDAFYAENKDSFVTKEERRCAVIYNNTRADAASVHAALSEAISQTPKAAKQIFGDFAKEKSSDPASAALKGDLGWFNSEGLNAKGQTRVAGLMLDRVFNLSKVHQVAPLQLESKQWVIVQLTGLKAAKEAPLEEVRLKIQDSLLKAKRVEARRAFIEGLRAEAKITIHEDVLAALPAPPPPAGPKIPEVPKPRLTPTPSAPTPASSDAAPKSAKPKTPKRGKAKLNPALFKRPAAPGVTRRPGQGGVPLKLEHSGPKAPEGVRERYLGPGQGGSGGGAP